MGITIDAIEALRRRLAELPRNQPREVSKQEAVALLASELGIARRRGYSPEEIAQLMSDQGVAINAATLRGYLRRKRRSPKGRPGTPAAVGAKTASTAQPASSAPAPARTAAAIQSPPIARSAREPAPAVAQDTQVHGRDGTAREDDR